MKGDKTKHNFTLAPRSILPIIPPYIFAEFCRRTGLTRSRARTVRAHGFRALPHGNSGRRTAPGVLAGHTGLVDDLLRKGVINSQVIFERLLGQGYAGGLTWIGNTYLDDSGRDSPASLNSTGDM